MPRKRHVRVLCVRVRDEVSHFKRPNNLALGDTDTNTRGLPFTAAAAAGVAKLKIPESKMSSILLPILLQDPVVKIHSLPELSK